jgi:hypothetical protein
MARGSAGRRPAQLRRPGASRILVAWRSRSCVLSSPLSSSAPSWASDACGKFGKAGKSSVRLRAPPTWVRVPTRPSSDAGACPSSFAARFTKTMFWPSRLSNSERPTGSSRSGSPERRFARSTSARRITAGLRQKGVLPHAPRRIRTRFSFRMIAITDVAASRKPSPRRQPAPGRPARAQGGRPGQARRCEGRSSLALGGRCAPVAIPKEVPPAERRGLSASGTAEVPTPEGETGRPTEHAQGVRATADTSPPPTARRRLRP